MVCNSMIQLLISGSDSVEICAGWRSFGSPWVLSISAAMCTIDDTDPRCWSTVAGRSLLALRTLWLDSIHASR